MFLSDAHQPEVNVLHSWAVFPVVAQHFRSSGGREATTGNTSAVRRLIKRGNRLYFRNTCIAQKRLELQHHKNVLLQ